MWFDLLVKWGDWAGLRKFGGGRSIFQSGLGNPANFVAGSLFMWRNLPFGTVVIGILYCKAMNIR